MGRTPVDAVQNVVSRAFVPRDLRTWAATRVLYPATDPGEGASVESVLAEATLRHSARPDPWYEVLASHCISPEAAEVFAAGNLEAFLEVRQAALARQLGLFLQQCCEWELEDTPSLDSLVLDDEDEARELSDDESSRY